MTRIVPVLMMLCLSAAPVTAQQGSGRDADEQAIRAILDNQISAWNAGDANAHGRDLAEDVIYTNIRGESLISARAFISQHAGIFRTIFRNTVAQQDIEELRFPAENVAVVRVLTSVSGLAQMPPGVVTDSQGRLRTKLLQVLVRRGGEWKIVAYHNTDVKAGVSIPEPGAKSREGGLQ